MAAERRSAAAEAPGDGPTHTLWVGGRFRLEGPAGEIAVSSKKARAILTILALSPRQERQRPWLAETLWGRSDDEHARNSLRGELSRLVHLFSKDASPIRLDSQSVALVPGAVAVERGDGEILEGLRLPGEIGFDAWLRGVRAGSPPPNAVAPHPAAPVEDMGPLLSRHVIRVGLAPVVAPGSRAGPAGADAAGNLMLSRIGHCLQEVGGIELVELRGTTLDAGSFAVPDIYLQCFARDGANGPDLTFSAVRSSDKAVVWSHAAASASPDDPLLVADVAERILARISVNPRLFSAERHLAVVRALEGVERMFSLTADNVAAADRCFQEASELHDASAFHAYRAYLTAIALAETRPTGDRRTDLVEHAREHVDAALRLDPTNGLSLSLLAHVNAFVLGEFELAGDLIEQAHSLGCSHVQTFHAETCLRLYSGDAQAARSLSMKTAMLGRFLPYRYFFVTTLCMTAALAGDHEAGIRHGKLALSLQPRALRKPHSTTLRYLGACYTQAGRLEEAREVYEQLVLDEPHLTSDIVGTPDYPVPAGPAAVLIRESLRRTGL